MYNCIFQQNETYESIVFFLQNLNYIIWNLLFKRNYISNPLSRVLHFALSKPPTLHPFLTQLPFRPLDFYHNTIIVIHLYIALLLCGSRKHFCIIMWIYVHLSTLLFPLFSAGVGCATLGGMNGWFMVQPFYV